MAVKEVSLADKVSATINDKAERSGERRFWAWADPGDDENFVLRNLGFGIFDRHPTDAGKMINSITVDLLGPTCWLDDDSDAMLWDVSVSYGPYNPWANASPLAMPPRIRAAGTRISKLAILDRDGKPILNTVGDPYDPPLEKDSTSLTFYILRNERVGDIVTAMVNVFRRSDKTNKYDFGPFPAGTLKTCTITLPDRQYDPVARAYYYPMEYGFEFDPDKWTKKVLNAGYRYLDQDSQGNPKLRQAMVDGSPATVPVLLTADGQKLDPPVDEDNIVVNGHDIYDELDYAEFGFIDATTGVNVFAQQNEPIPPPTDGSGGFD